MVLTRQALIKGLKSTFSYLHQLEGLHYKKWFLIKKEESKVIRNSEDLDKQKELTDLKETFKLKGEASLSLFRVEMHHASFVSLAAAS